MTINVLGTEYTVTVKKYDEDEAFERSGIAGYCDSATRRIVVCDMSTYHEMRYESKETQHWEQIRIMRHEIVHAFFCESGLDANTNPISDAWARNEELVDWIAIQGPKIWKAWEEAGAI